MAGLVCGFLVLLASVSLGQSSQIRAKINPSTPSAFMGRNIIMNCTLEAADDVALHDLRFSWTNPDINEKSTITYFVADRTIRLNISRVYLNMSSSIISCRLGNSTLDEVAIVVDEPRFPNITKCVVYNWESMTCFWERDETDNTTLSLAYSRSTCQPSRAICLHPIEERGHGNCTWRALDSTGNMYLSVDHCLVFMLTNAFNVSALGRRRIVEVDNIVKPNPVTIRPTKVDSNYAELSWQPPFDGKQIIFRVAYESRFSSILIRNTTETSITISNLIPNTKYTVTVDCIPIIRSIATGFWSDQQTMEFTTEPDVPGDSPSVTPGGFLVVERSASQRSVKLFFQPVDDFHSHGKITAYRARYSVRNSTTEEEFADFKTNVFLSLEVDSTYRVSLDVRTIEGYNNSLIPKMVVISRQSELPSFPENFFVQTDDKGTFTLNWTLVDQASSYTLYWCNSSLMMFDCRTPVNWKILPSNQTSEVLHLVGLPDLSVRFAISVERVTPSGETVSSGMLIANCTYSRNKELKPPEGVGVMRTSPTTMLVHLSRPDRTSSFEKCADRGYASHYRISYCPENHCEETEENLTVESFRASVVIDGLKESESYEVRIQSLSENRISSVAARVMPAATKQTFPIGVAVALVVFCVGSCIIAGVVKLVCHVKKKWHIEVKPPPKYVTDPEVVASERNAYSKFLRSDLNSGGHVQTTVWVGGQNKVRRSDHHGYFNSVSMQPGEDESLLLKRNSDYKSSTSSSQLSPIPSMQSNSSSLQSSSERRDSGISASISGYNIVTEQPCENSDAYANCSRAVVPHDNTFVTVSESC